jgi:hypothetical protein
MRNLHPTRILLFLIFLSGYTTQSVGQATGSWSTAGIKGNFNDHWGAFGEFQMRSLSFYDRFYYYELKGGATYSLNKKFSMSLATGYYNTFNGGEAFEDYSKQKEFRIFEQFNYEQEWSVLEIEHRLRVEQRFRDRYANRFRYRCNISAPLNKKKITRGAFYLSCYDEVFFTDETPVFARNRFFAGGGYQFTNKFSLQMGWLRQNDYSGNSSRNRNYFFTGFSFNLKNNPQPRAGSIIE